MPRPVMLEILHGAPRTRASAGPDTVVLAKDAFEEARLASYEDGYKAGWDDAVAAAEADGETLRREVAQNLQALSFTFHEARGHLMEGVGPLLDAICERLLPEIAQAAIGGIVRETLLPLAGQATDRPVTLVLNPAARPAVESALADGSAPPVVIVEDADLGRAAVQLRSDTEERRIDLDAAVAEIRTAVAAFFAARPDPAPRIVPESAPETVLDPQETLKHG